MKVQVLIDYLEELAPLSLQESYDNSGLIVGSASQEVSKAILCLDATEEVVDEAIKVNAGLIIAHHPIVFSGLKKLNGKNYVERVVMKAIKHDIAIYAIHTNLDNVEQGVNAKIAEKIGLRNTEILAPISGGLLKLVSFVPVNDTAQVLEALFEAGAGNIGNYKEASFRGVGEGTFKGNEKSNPVIGSQGVRERVTENKIEVLVEDYRVRKVVSALKKAHPYEEVAYDLIALKNEQQNVGAGFVGELENAMETKDFLKMLQEVFQVPVIRHTNLCKEKIKNVAICGGAGSFLLQQAKRKKADIFITGDFKYHEFFDAENQIVIADIGHYESEQYTSELLMEKLNKKFSKFAFLLTEVNTNPVKYFI